MACNFFKNTKNFKYLLAVIFSAVFFLCANFLNFGGLSRFNSPDETAAYVFAGVVAQGLLPVMRQSDDFGEWNRFVFPRSTFADENGRVVQAGFWGWSFVLGVLAKIFGLRLVVFVTSVLTLVSSFAFRSLTKKVFSEKIADISWFLFLFHPAVLYYSARGLFANLAVLDLVVLSAWFFFQKNYARFYVAWFLLGLAVFIRPSEIWWILIGWVFFYFFSKKHTNFHFYLAGFLAMIFYAFLYWIINKNILGQGFVAAYQATGSLSGGGIMSWLLPFGFHPRNFLRAGFDYLVVLPWAFSLPALFGAFYCLKKEKKRFFYAYFFAAVFISIFLVVFYGSYSEARHNWLTLGIAFSRYWIPIFIFSIPFAAAAAFCLVDLFSKCFRKILIFFILIFWLAQSMVLTFGGPDGLVATREGIIYGKKVLEQTQFLVPNNAVILTQTEDKFFWPDLAVMKNVFNPDILRAARGLLGQGRKIYFFTPFLPRLSEKQTADQFASFGLEISSLRFFDSHTLYSVSLEKK